uniref:WD repeat-containing protein on Y chromosome n=1 Tax=Amphiprion percula TaxID=161767 RepID=A0A3P8S225_AMPPE
MKPDTAKMEVSPTTSVELSLPPSPMPTSPIADLVKLFKEADVDNSGGLNIEEFCSALMKIFKSIPKDDLMKLHMKIDTNCDRTVDLGELLDYVNQKDKVLKRLEPKSQPFPKPAKVIPVGRQNLVRVFVIRPYVKCQYLAVSADGLLQCWTHDMEDSLVVPLYKKEHSGSGSHRPRMHVIDMAYIPELNQVAVSTSIKELLFFDCGHTAAHFNLAYALVEEEYTVTSMNYWSGDSRGIFAYGTEKGYLTLLISHNKTSLWSYKICFVSRLLRCRSQSFVALRIPVFTDDCKDIRYFPELRSFAVCGRSSSMMVLVELPSGCYGFSQKVSKRCFNSPNTQRFFTCVDYSPSSQFLMTGGADGCLRVLYPGISKSSSIAKKLTGHTRPITHLAYNLREKIFISVSEDKNIRVWKDGTWVCLQSFYIYGMKDTPVSSMCYNTLNNELYLANTHLGYFFGIGTDVYQSLLRSHHMPLCTVLYHELFKQVISICQAGVVSVWDVFTRKAVMQFKVTAENCVGHTVMSLDPSRRKLIVVTSDGKLSFWNFNNGKELYVHPVSMPKQATAVVCSMNRVFVSMKGSNIIFDLDTQGQKNRFLKHHLLKDITCMDLHESRLITLSSDENLVVWNADTAMVMYTINNTCPLVLLASETDQGKISDLPFKKISQSKKTRKTNAKVEPCILCLKTRPFNKDTATVLVSASGYISAWAVTIRGRLIAKFKAVKNDGTYITCMSTNTDESILLTGHSNGIVCLWDIEHFGFKANADDGPCENIDEQQVSLRPPPLLTSWQAHPTKVVSVLYVLADDKIITAGLDCFVKHWTDRGDCVGIYGKEKWDENTIISSPELDMKPDTAKMEVSPTTVELSLPPSPTPPIANVEELRDEVQMVLLRLRRQYASKDPKLCKAPTKIVKEIKENKTATANLAEDPGKLKSSPPAHTVQQGSQHVDQQPGSQTVKQSQNQHVESPDLSSAKSKDFLQKEPIFMQLPSETQPALRRPKLTPQRLWLPLPPDDYRPQRTADAPQTASRDLSSQQPSYLPLIQSKHGLIPHPPAADTKDLRSRDPQVLVEGFKTEQKNADMQRFRDKFTLEDVPGKNLAIKPLPPQKQPETKDCPWRTSRRLRLTPQRLWLPLPPDDYRPQRTADAPQTASHDLSSQQPSYLPLIQSKHGLIPHPPAADTKDLRSRDPQVLVEGFKKEQKNADMQRFREKFTLEDVPGKNLAIKPLPPQKQPETKESPWRTSRRLRLKPKLT